MTAGCRWQGDDLLLAVRVQPRASRDELLIDGDRLRARITAPPVEGAANAHLLRFLADEFGVNASRVRLVRGGTAREKVVHIASPGRLPAALAASLTALRNG